MEERFNRTGHIQGFHIPPAWHVWLCIGATSNGASTPPFHSNVGLHMRGIITFKDCYSPPLACLIVYRGDLQWGLHSTSTPLQVSPSFPQWPTATTPPTLPTKYSPNQNRSNLKRAQLQHLITLSWVVEKLSESQWQPLAPPSWALSWATLTQRRCSDPGKIWYFENAFNQLLTLRWDTLEDFVIYGLIMLGLIISPTTIFNGTPLYCTPCISVSWFNHHNHHLLSRHHIVISTGLADRKRDFHNVHTICHINLAGRAMRGQAEQWGPPRPPRVVGQNLLHTQCTWWDMSRIEKCPK